MFFGYRNPMYPMHQLRTEMDRLLNGWFGPAVEGFWSAAHRGQPAVNVWEQGDAIVVEMEIPGVRSDQVDVSVAGNELSIKINRPDMEQEGVTYHRRERPVGSFARVLRLPCEVDAQKVEAELRDGVLTVTLWKAESAKPRKIEVVGS